MKRGSVEHSRKIVLINFASAAGLAIFTMLAVSLSSCVPPKSGSKDKAGKPSETGGGNTGGQISPELAKLFTFLSDPINRKATQKLDGKHVYETGRMFGRKVDVCVSVSTQAGKCKVYQNFGTPQSFVGTCAARVHGNLVGIFCKKDDGMDCVPDPKGRPDTTGVLLLSEERGSDVSNDTSQNDGMNEGLLDPVDPREEALKLLDKSTFKDRWNNTITIDRDSCSDFLK